MQAPVGLRVGVGARARYSKVIGIPQSATAGSSGSVVGYGGVIGTPAAEYGRSSRPAVGYGRVLVAPAAGYGRVIGTPGVGHSRVIGARCRLRQCYRGPLATAALLGPRRRVRAVIETSPPGAGGHPDLATGCG